MLEAYFVENQGALHIFAWHKRGCTCIVPALFNAIEGESPVSRSCRSFVGGLVAALVMQAAPVAHAQGLEIAPIGFDVADEGDNLVLAAFSAPNDAPVLGGLQIGATPVAARAAEGLPLPSIIVGLIAPGQEEAFGLERLLPATVAQVGFELDDLTSRAALRESDPDLFRRLIEEGHLDPDAAQLNRVLQSELARMNCYRSGIDGAWGPGSRRSVGEYFEQVASLEWPDAAPTNDLLRTIILNGDVACPTPVAAAPAPRATTTRSTTQRATTTRSQPRAAAPAPRAAAPAAKPKTKPKLSLGGSGVLR